MNMNFNLNLTQEQKLIMTQQMQLSIKLLQLSSIELHEFVDKEIEENPVLEYAADPEEDKTTDIKNRIDYKELIKYLDFDNYGTKYYDKNEDEEFSPLNFISEKKSLKHYLIEQINDLSIEASLNSICIYIVENLDERGYLTFTREEIADDLKVSERLIATALNIVQSLDPPGIAAKDIKECLIIQLSRKGKDSAELTAMITNHLEDLAQNRYSNIAKALGLDIKKVQQYGDLIKSLNPKPSSGFYSGEDVNYIIPDAYVRKSGNQFHIIMNEEIIPKLNINEKYREIINNDEKSELVEYVKEKINNAMFLLKSIENRKSTIYKVIEKIVHIQKDFFECGESYLKPMTLRDIADAIEMHESTVSRAIKDKYINTDRGIIKLKNLFTVGISGITDSDDDISAALIKKEIKLFVEKEDKTKPLSDQSICDLLNTKSMNISRRTVAKYREELGIKSSSKRKRF